MEALLEQWRYAAIFLMVILGNMGLPVPEETVLTLGGYLASRGVTRLHWVVVIGVISAVIGDNIGYWLGRRYGRAAIEPPGTQALQISNPLLPSRERSRRHRRAPSRHASGEHRRTQQDQEDAAHTKLNSRRAVAGARRALVAAWREIAAAWL